MSDKKKATKLTDISITHISLVKAGANGKDIIYKSSENDPLHQHQIKISKTDDEKGVIYGVVYAPNQVDTDGEYTDADEIIKAAYNFMKSKNTTNVDKSHSFNNEKAFIAESWIIKENDSIFPEEALGSWAVAIQLEDDVLKEQAKTGEIAGISMAGTATKIEPEVSKADEKSFSMDDVLNMFKKIFGRTSVEISGHVYNDEANIHKSQEGEELKKEDVEKTIKEEIEKSVKPLNQKIEDLEKENGELVEKLKKSKQDDTPAKTDVEKANSIEGIL